MIREILQTKREVTSGVNLPYKTYWISIMGRYLELFCFAKDETRYQDHQRDEITADRKW